jgi:hypothetical protein
VRIEAYIGGYFGPSYWIDAKDGVLSWRCEHDDADHHEDPDIFDDLLPLEIETLQAVLEADRAGEDPFAMLAARRNTTTMRPHPRAWASFWRKVDAAGVWDWKPRYLDPGALDGTSWTLTLEHDGRRVQSSGSNAYPPGWKQVQRALEQLSGKTWR